MKKTLILSLSILTLGACTTDIPSAQDLTDSAVSKIVDGAKEVVEKKIEGVMEQVNLPVEDRKAKYEETTPLKDVVGDGSSGIAYRNSYSPTTGYSHRVEAVLPTPKGTNFYEGWIENKAANDVISTGRMTVSNDGGYELDFSSPIDYSPHTHVVITLETIADAIPEKHVLDGNF